MTNIADLTSRTKLCRWVMARLHAASTILCQQQLQAMEISLAENNFDILYISRPECSEKFTEHCLHNKNKLRDEFWKTKNQQQSSSIYQNNQSHNFDFQQNKYLNWRLNNGCYEKSEFCKHLSYRTFVSQSNQQNSSGDCSEFSIQGQVKKIQQQRQKQNSKIQSSNLSQQNCQLNNSYTRNDNYSYNKNNKIDFDKILSEKNASLMHANGLKSDKNQQFCKNNKILRDQFEKLPEDYVRGMMGSMGIRGQQFFGNIPIREIKGVGKKNEQILTDAGCAYLWQLVFLFQYRFASNKDSMYEYLTEIGIKKHKQSIIEFLMSDNILVRNSVITLEGNIGAGKTTFLNSLSPYTRSKIQVFEEPIEQWQNVKYSVKNDKQQTDSFNLLQRFYSNPYSAFQFQTYVLGTKIGHAAYTADPFHFSQHMQQQQHMFNMSNMHTNNMVHLLERSVFADRLVFVRSLHNEGLMNDEEVSIYDSWFDQLINHQFRNLVPDGFVYLRADPEVCEHRMKKRNRQEEIGVSLNYLEGLHEMHEDWLNNNCMDDLKDEAIKELLFNRRNQIHQQQRLNGGLTSQFLEKDIAIKSKSETIQSLFYDALDISKISSIPQIPNSIKNSEYAKIQFIDPKRNTNLRKYPGIGAVPTLVIDWNLDWDVQNDVKKQKQIAEVVQDFVEWVQKFKPLIRIPELLPHSIFVNQ